MSQTKKRSLEGEIKNSTNNKFERLSEKDSYKMTGKKMEAMATGEGA